MGEDQHQGGNLSNQPPIEQQVPSGDGAHLNVFAITLHLVAHKAELYINGKHDKMDPRNAYSNKEKCCRLLCGFTFRRQNCIGGYVEEVTSQALSCMMVLLI